MAKYIKLDDLLEDIEHSVVFALRPDKPSSINAELRGANKIIDRIRCAPAADVVEVRHGRWLTKEYMYGDPDVGTEDMWIDRLAEQSDYYAYCSICGKAAGYNGEESLILSDYCPNCGAKMDGGEDDA